MIFQIMHTKFIALCLCSIITVAVAPCPQGYVVSSIDSNKCYKFVTSSKASWSDAQDDCRSVRYGYLVSVQSAFENNNIQTAEDGNSRLCNYWLGFNDIVQTGKYVWADNAPANYQNWLPGQPSSNGKCTTMLYINGKWTIEDCAALNCFVCETYITPPNYLPAENSTDCYDLLHYEGKTTSGIYTVYPPGIAPFQVYCDMTTEGGGWVVFQRRIDNTTMFFNRTWAEYKNGFGDRLDRNSWLGLDKVNALTKKDYNVSLRIDIHGNRCPQSQCNISTNSNWYGEWSGFKIENETMAYTLRLVSKIASNMTSIYSNEMLIESDRPFIVVSDGGYDATGAWWNAGNGGYIFLNGKYEYNTTFFDKYYGFCYRYWNSYLDNYFVYPIQSQMMFRKITLA